MKRLMVLAVLGLALMSGCESNNGNVTVREFRKSEGPSPLVITPLNGSSFEINGRWRQIEFAYKGQVHVYLQNYDGDNQAIVPVGVFDR